MKISTKGRYGLLMMMDLAIHEGSGPVLAPVIAERQGLPLNYLHLLTAPLKSQGLIRIHRGRSGGCELSRPSKAINVLEILDALEGRMVLQESNENNPGAKAIAWILGESLEACRAVLSECTLWELAERLKAADTDSTDYCI